MTARSINWAVLAHHGLLPLLAGCSGSQSTLNPQGLEAERLAKLFWLFTGVCGAVWVIGRDRHVRRNHAPARGRPRSRSALSSTIGQERTNDLCRRRAGDPDRSDSESRSRFSATSRPAASPPPAKLSPSRSPAINGGGTSNTKAPTPRRSSTRQTRFTCLSDARSRSTSRPRMSSIASGFPT